VNHSPATREGTEHRKNTRQHHHTTAAADYSRSAQLLTTRHLATPQTAHMPETQERSTATAKLSVRLQTLPQKFQSRALLTAAPRTVAGRTQELRAEQNTSSSRAIEQCMAKTSQSCVSTCDMVAMDKLATIKTCQAELCLEADVTSLVRESASSLLCSNSSAKQHPSN
jgi:hypothetical protein